jgi:hypothetical protein
VTAVSFERSCEMAGLHCVSQELVNWGTRRLIDCFSVIVPKRAQRARENCIIRNPDFMLEAELIRRVSRLYALGRMSGSTSTA